MEVQVGDVCPEHIDDEQGVDKEGEEDVRDSQHHDQLVGGAKLLRPQAEDGDDQDVGDHRNHH